MNSEIFKILNAIENIGSTSSKEELLIQGIKLHPELERFLRLMYNDTVYGISEQSFVNALNLDNDTEHVSIELLTILGTNEPTIEELENYLIELKERSGDNLLQYLQLIFQNLDPLHAKWFCRCILHDSRAGFGIKTLNKVLGEQIEVFEMQLASKIDIYNLSKKKMHGYDKIKFPCAVEIKFDGIRIQAEKFDGEVTLTSRKGLDKTESYPEIVNALKTDFAQDNLILDGELIKRVGDGHSFQQMMRKDGNKNYQYVVFDLLNQENLDYKSRYDNLKSLLWTPIDNSRITLTENWICNNIDEVREIFEMTQDKKLEGIMIKELDKPYDRGSRKNMYKCKIDYIEGRNSSHEADLLCVGWKYGSGKNYDKVGTLCLQDASGIIKGDVGSGIDDYWREILTIEKDNLIGKIVQIRYNELTETNSFRFPRFIAVRDDKTVPDMLLFGEDLENWSNSQ